jgi:AraC family ethanolamine operon transcriptional activator
VRIVRRAQDHAESRLGESIRMHDLCAAAGASLASLERAFLDLHGMSPKRFLTLHRLSRVRRALILGAEGTATVTEVATACGFFHLGRFAGLYKAFFHEPPSATLRLARAA